MKGRKKGGGEVGVKERRKRLSGEERLRWRKIKEVEIKMWYRKRGENKKRCRQKETGK